MFLVIASTVLLADFYFYSATKSLVESWSWGKYVKIGFWITTLLLLSSFGIVYYMYISGAPVSGNTRGVFMGVMFVLFVPRMLAVGVFVIDDIIRLFRYLFSLFNTSSIASASEGGIPRLKFLQLTGLGVFGVFLSMFTYGILKGAYNYKVLKRKLKIPNLPKQFEGLKIVQISDLHVGSFFSTKPLEQAIELINEQKPDLIFFTGDLVNEISEEAVPYIPVLKKMKANLGIYSILGNHDYGDYFYDKESPELTANKKHNKDLMKSIHAQSGFNLLLDESVQLEREGEQISIIGIENWGLKAGFPKYGELYKAVKGTEKSKVKLLLSHDPSHWDAEVRTEYKDIDVTFSGHTHGMQFGIEIPGIITWSPVKYLYKQWAGLYEEGNQKLYVNRGLGFIGYPGRVGISPEISVFELTKG
ncbi:MAG: putative MPP superfamily phosphohydrolase [Saprospiraceae bacterium]|jgi:predicted MPP superfamily phosphohydrolase